jgi:hypothetical protein
MYSDTAAPTAMGTVTFLTGGNAFTSGSAGYGTTPILNDEYIKGYDALFLTSNIGIGN